LVTLQLHNTLTRRKEEFRPVDPANVRMYVCGPTVYQRIHIGNARPLIVFDVLFRLLRHLYGEKHVTYVRNITDIDDKIIDQARKNGEPIEALTERTYAAFREDVAALGCLPPTHEPRATAHIPGMVALIDKLIANGNAYAADGHVLFHVPSMPHYGRLSGRNREDQIAGARVDVAPYKRDAADFVLWKPSTGDQPGWDSPWGRGRPGWHIECSAMSEELLGPLPFDIHGGGLDLIFPHHENEIAQSCCARHVDRMANYWMHNGFVDMRGEKMSKSVGNVLRMDQGLAEFPGQAFRMWMLGTHYRKPIDYSAEAVRTALDSLVRMYGFYKARGVDVDDAQAEVSAAEVLPAVVDALLDDLNTPQALTELNEALKRIRADVDLPGRRAEAFKIIRTARLMGLLTSQAELDGWVRGKFDEMKIYARINERKLAREKRDFKTADLIRQELLDEGIVLEDTPSGTKWRRA
jgi:cysteinyl-tRNA synthetase